MRVIRSSTSRPAVIIKSASSSITITMNGNVSTPCALASLLYSNTLRTPKWDICSYRDSICLTTHFKTGTDCFGSVTIGNRRCEISAYGANSNRFGSIKIMRSSSGVHLQSKLMSIEFSATDLPDPVDPAISRWGIFAKSTTTSLPTVF